jgi:hypothetical protein
MVTASSLRGFVMNPTVGAILRGRDYKICTALNVSKKEKAILDWELV